MQNFILFWYIPLPMLNLTPPRISLWPSLSWSQTVSSRDRSQRASKEMSSQAMVCSHFGQTVFRQTPVFCLPPLAFSGSKYLEIKKQNVIFMTPQRKITYCKSSNKTRRSSSFSQAPIAVLIRIWAFLPLTVWVSFEDLWYVHTLHTYRFYMDTIIMQKIVTLETLSSLKLHIP